MDVRRARELVAGERRRIEAALADLDTRIAAEREVARQQPGEAHDGDGLAVEMVDRALANDLEAELRAVERAEARIADGSYGRSIESGLPIPDERLEVAPLAELTVDEQQAYEAGRQGVA